MRMSLKQAKMSVELVDYMGSDLSVVNAARVSFDKKSDWEHSGFDTLKSVDDENHLSEKDQKLIKYLAKHNHWSPFAHNSLQFRIKAPIFVARQLVKHQVGGVWNEVSRRYVDDEPEFYFPETWRGRSVNAKQGSSDVKVKLKPLSEGHEDLWGDVDNDFEIPLHTQLAVDNNLDLYHWMINSGVAPEQARMILPQNTMTEWIWTGSLAFFARVCKQRLDPHTQQETQEVAKLINQDIPKDFQHSWKALMEN